MNKKILKFLDDVKFDDFKKENIKEHNQNWPQSLDHPCRILIIGSSGLGKKIH